MNNATSSILRFSLNDKTNLPYLEAVANEVQRIVGIAFTGIFRIAKVLIKCLFFIKSLLLFIVSKILFEANIALN